MQVGGNFEDVGVIPQNRHIAITAVMVGIGVRDYQMHREMTTGAYHVRVRPIDMDRVRSLIG
jgi:hypothetical protein